MRSANRTSIQRRILSNGKTDPNGTWLYRIGGGSALAIGAGYLAIVALYIPMGAPPHGAEAILPYIAANTTSWRAILWLSVLTDVLFLPVTMALYAYLGGVLAVFGPLFLSALSTTIVVASLLTTIWLFFVGFRLWKLGPM